MNETARFTLSDARATAASPAHVAAARIVSLVALYGLLSVVLLKAQLFGDRSFFSCCDSSVQSYAWLGKVAAAARHLTVPLWSFGTYAGGSFAGELQPAPFYPPTWILGWLGFDGMPLVDIFIVAHFALGATFMHLLLRAVGLARTAAIAGALIFAFTGYVPAQAAGQPNIYAGLVWIPLVFFFYRQAFAAGRTSVALTYAGLAGAAGAMQIVAGHLQPFIYTSYAAATYAFVDGMGGGGRRWSIRPLALIVAGQLLATGFAAVPLALSLQYLRLVYRWYGDADNGGMSTFPHAVSFRSWSAGAVMIWRDFGTLLNPALTLARHGGTMFLTLTGLAAAVLSLVRPTRFAAALWLIATASIVVALGGELGKVSRITFYMPLLSQTRTPVRALYLFSFAASALAAVGIDNLRRVVAALAPRLAPAIAGALLLGVAYEVAVFTPGLGMPNKYVQYPPTYYGADPGLTAIERLSTTGPRVDRYMAVPTDLIPPNAGDLMPVMNVLGHRGTMLVSEFDYIAKGWGPVVSDQLDRLGVRWLISDKPLDGLRLVEQGQGYFIYERPHALGVFWTIDPVTGTPARAPVEAVRWGENHVDVRLGSIPPGRKLVFAQPSYPGWVAIVDGRQVPMGQEEIFSTIDVTDGLHDVTFAYRPRLWPWLLVFLLSVAITVAAALSWACPASMTPLTARASTWTRRTGLARILR